MSLKYMEHCEWSNAFRYIPCLRLVSGVWLLTVAVQCNNTMARDHWQDLLEGMNERWTKTEADDVSRGADDSCIRDEERKDSACSLTLSQGKLRADGDIDLLKGDFSSFRYPSCESCGGVMKPGVVFFGVSTYCLMARFY